MNFVTFQSPTDFLTRCRGFLMDREAENNLLLGLVMILSKEKDFHKTPFYLAAFVQDGAIVGAVLQMAGRPCIITRMPEPCFSFLVEDRLEKEYPIDGLIGPRKWATALKDRLEEMTGCRYRVLMLQLLYELTEVKDVPMNEGTLRIARMEDVSLATKFYAAFIKDAMPDEPLEDFSVLIEKRILEEQMYFWEHAGRILSMAGWSGKTVTGVRINAVYTPPDFRGKGYATSCVAALSKLMLSSGRSRCFLYTDQTNRTSNNIYQKIGYRVVSESVRYGIVDGS